MAEAPQLVFRVSESVCGIPLAAISEVSLPGPLSRIPKAASPLLGIVNLRGRIVVVADLGLLLGREPASRGRATERLLVLAGGRRDLAVLVSEVLSIAHLGAGGEEAGEPEPETAETFTGEELSARVSALLADAGPGPAAKGS